MEKQSFLLASRTHSSSSLHLFTDASDLGFGCIFGRKWFFGQFFSDWLQFHIAVREFLPIVISLEIWCHQFHNSTVVLHCDNNTVVHVINKTTSKDPNLMILMRRLMLLSLQHNIHFVTKHVPGVNNSAADMLSRLQVTEFQARFPHMEHEPTQVPLELVRL